MMQKFLNNVASSFIGGLTGLLALLMLMKYDPTGLTDILHPKPTVVISPEGQSDLKSIEAIIGLMENSGMIAREAIDTSDFKTGEEYFTAYCEYLLGHGVINSCEIID